MVPAVIKNKGKFRNLESREKVLKLLYRLRYFRSHTVADPDIQFRGGP